MWVYDANGIHVTDNVIKNSAQYGIALTEGSSNSLVEGNIVKNSGVFENLALPRILPMPR